MPFQVDLEAPQLYFPEEHGGRCSVLVSAYLAYIFHAWDRKKVRCENILSLDIQASFPYEDIFKLAFSRMLVTISVC